jgi:predicted RNase H-like nuclease
MFIVGVDLAWGERKRDGLCLIEASRHRAVVRAVAHTLGDEAFLWWLQEHTKALPVMVMVDAPIVCPNATGSRPVDRLTHRLFGRQHAGCHPANSTKCPRPARLAKRLAAAGCKIGWDFRSASRLVCEVYPHPAMLRLFGLDRIVKYKRGPVANRRREFRRLQALLRNCLAQKFPELKLNEQTTELLTAGWSKPVEDKLDALFCALIGCHHYLRGPGQSEVLGDRKSGFILLPK